jgi:integrase
MALHPSEVKRLIKAAKKNRNGVRDGLMIYMAERHGYRANELVELKRSAINLKRHLARLAIEGRHRHNAFLGQLRGPCLGSAVQRRP